MNKNADHTKILSKLSLCLTQIKFNDDLKKLTANIYKKTEKDPALITHVYKNCTKFNCTCKNFVHAFHINLS